MKNFRELVGKKIRNRRIQRGIKTQTQLADLLDINVSRVSDWERGIHLPEGKLKERLLDLLEADENLLDISKGTASADALDLMLELISAFKDATDRRRSAALYFLTGKAQHLRAVDQSLQAEFELMQTHLDRIPRRASVSSRKGTS